MYLRETKNERHSEFLRNNYPILTLEQYANMKTDNDFTLIMTNAEAKKYEHIKSNRYVFNQRGDVERRIKTMNPNIPVRNQLLILNKDDPRPNGL